MANQYIGVDGIARKVKSEYIGAGGVARKVKSGYVGVSGISRKYFPGGIPLATFAEGSIVKINETGKPVEFYVAKHNYEPGLNGRGRTLLVRKDCYREYPWSYYGDSDNRWAQSTMRSELNGPYLNMLDVAARELLGETKYYSMIGNGSWDVSPRSDPVFALSLAEFGLTDSMGKAEGSSLPNPSYLRIAKLDGVAIDQWTRSPRSSYNYAYRLTERGDVAYGNCNYEYRYGYRPCFTLPSTVPFDNNMNFIGA